MDDVQAHARSNYHVLVVEDNAMIGVGLVTYLEELGATVTWSTSVDDALFVVNSDGRIDAAIVDMNLNGSWSSRVIDRLLDRKIFTALCTGYELENIEECHRSLPRLEKPFIRRAVRELLTSYL